MINGVPYVHDLLVKPVLLGFSCVYRGLRAHVLLNLLNELEKRDKKRGLPSILSLFCNKLTNSII